MALNFRSSCLNLLCAGIKDIHHHALLVLPWGLDLGPLDKHYQLSYIPSLQYCFKCSISPLQELFSNLSGAVKFKTQSL